MPKQTSPYYLKSLLAASGGSALIGHSGSTLDLVLALLAPLASPALTGNPTAPTQTASNNSTRIATTAFVQAAIAALVNASPAALDTLNELAAALGNDANFATTMTNALAAKAPLASPTFTGTPAGPTAAPGANTTQLATTAFVAAALAASPQTLQPLTTYTPAGVAAVDVDFLGTYDRYILVIDNLIPVTDGVAARIAFSTDGGSTFLCDIEYQHFTMDATTLAGARSNGTTYQFSDNNVSNVVANGGVSAQFIFSKPLSTTAATRAQFKAVTATPTPQLRTREGWLQNDHGSTEDWTDARITFSAGNIASGNIYLFGMRTA